MNDTLLIFGVLPGTVCFIGFVLSLVFGPEIMRRYNEQRALQRPRLRSAPAEPVEEPVEKYGFEPVSNKREKELVHS
jgi:hypothetical protein